MLTAKFRPFALHCYCSNDCFFIFRTNYVFERTALLPAATCLKTGDKMMQMRLHTLNRHRSKCLVDIILKAYIISKALEICHRWLASYLDCLQCKYCKLQGVFFFVEKQHGHFSDLKAIVGDKFFPSSSYFDAFFRVDVVVSLHVSIPILVFCLPELGEGNFTVDGSVCILERMEKECL